MIGKLDCKIIVIGLNKLGIINHARLTVEDLSTRGLYDISVVLMNCERRDASVKTNSEVIRNNIKYDSVEISFLGRKGLQRLWILHTSKKNKKTLARILN